MLGPTDRRNTSSPPRPKLVFRVGVVGHRPGRLQAVDALGLREQVRIILTAVREAVANCAVRGADLYCSAPFALRMISPLAEGADRIVGEEALDLGYGLCCPMPFEQAEFERDFASGDGSSFAREDFHALLERARHAPEFVIFEMDGRREEGNEAYVSCGQVVLNQSDLVIGVWDGEWRGRDGGTEQTLREAQRRGVPVVWLDARAPHTWQVLRKGDRFPQARNGRSPVPSASPVAHLADVVEMTLMMPSAEAEKAQAQGLRDFYAEDGRRFRGASLWRFWSNLVGSSRLPRRRVDIDGERGSTASWSDESDGFVRDLLIGLDPFFSWPDRLAIRYAETYRSGFLLAFILAATAVGLALLPFAAGWSEGHGDPREAVCITLELLTIVSVLFIVDRSRRRRWHERWLDYRLAAELMRHMRLVLPLGGGRAFPEIPGHLAGYHPARTWMAWYVRAVEREFGLPAVRLEEQHRARCVAEIELLLRNQRAYHHATADSCGRIERRLHHTGLLLLFLTLTACALHALPHFTSGVEIAPPVARWLTFVCGFFPALGAAIAGISNQSEFRRIERRSEAMVQQLAVLQDEAGMLRSPDGVAGSREIASLTHRAARLMVDEVLDWRVVLLDRPPEHPT